MENPLNGLTNFDKLKAQLEERKRQLNKLHFYPKNKSCAGKELYRIDSGMGYIFPNIVTNLTPKEYPFLRVWQKVVTTESTDKNAPFLLAKAPRYAVEDGYSINEGALSVVEKRPKLIKKSSEDDDFEVVITSHDPVTKRVIQGVYDGGRLQKVIISASVYELPEPQKPFSMATSSNPMQSYAQHVRDTSDYYGPAKGVTGKMLDEIRLDNTLMFEVPIISREYSEQALQGILGELSLRAEPVFDTRHDEYERLIGLTCIDNPTSGTLTLNIKDVFSITTPRMLQRAAK